MIYLVILIYILVFGIFGLYSFLNYQDDFKANTGVYIASGLGLAMLGNLLWLILTKILPSNQSIYIGGIIYDSLVTAAFVLIPWYFIGISLSGLQWSGLVVVLLGLLILKLGG